MLAPRTGSRIERKHQKRIDAAQAEETRRGGDNAAGKRRRTRGNTIIATA